MESMAWSHSCSVQSSAEYPGEAERLLVWVAECRLCPLFSPFPPLPDAPLPHDLRMREDFVMSSPRPFPPPLNALLKNGLLRTPPPRGRGQRRPPSLLPPPEQDQGGQGRRRGGASMQTRAHRGPLSPSSPAAHRAVGPAQQTQKGGSALMTEPRPCTHVPLCCCTAGEGLVELCQALMRAIAVGGGGGGAASSGPPAAGGNSKGSSHEGQRDPGKASPAAAAGGAAGPIVPEMGGTESPAAAEV